MNVERAVKKPQEAEGGPSASPPAAEGKSTLRVKTGRPSEDHGLLSDRDYNRRMDRLRDISLREAEQSLIERLEKGHRRRVVGDAPVQIPDGAKMALNMKRQFDALEQLADAIQPYVKENSWDRLMNSKMGEGIGLGIGQVISAVAQRLSAGNNSGSSGGRGGPTINVPGIGPMTREQYIQMVAARALQEKAKALQAQTPKKDTEEGEASEGSEEERAAEPAREAPSPTHEVRLAPGDKALIEQFTLQTQAVVQQLADISRKLETLKPSAEPTIKISEGPAAKTISLTAQRLRKEELLACKRHELEEKAEQLGLEPDDYSKKEHLVRAILEGQERLLEKKEE